MHREAELRAETEEKKRQEAATLDVVTPGYQHSEVEHLFQGQNSAMGDFLDRKFREAHHAGSSARFSYKLACSDEPLELVATYWGGEWSNYEFDILVDGQKIATQNVGNKRPGDFVQQVYSFPMN